jgi:hypothetical protein
MESAPDDFMYDAWGIKMMYVAHDKQVYFWSAGPDMYHEAVDSAINEELIELEGMDDIIMTIARVRRAFETPTTVTPAPRGGAWTEP